MIESRRQRGSTWWRAAAEYALATAAVMLAALLLLRLLLEGPGWNGVVAAAAVAWLVQAVTFALMAAYRRRQRAFLAVWMGGTPVRMAVVVLAAWAAMRSPALATAPTLVALVACFFGLLLVEPLFLRRVEGPHAPDGDGGRPRPRGRRIGQVEPRMHNADA